MRGPLQAVVRQLAMRVINSLGVLFYGIYNKGYWVQLVLQHLNISLTIFKYFYRIIYRIEYSQD